MAGVRSVGLFAPEQQNLAYQQALAAQLAGAPAIDQRGWEQMRQVPVYGVGHGLTDAGQRIAAALMQKNVNTQQNALSQKMLAAQLAALGLTPGGGGGGGSSLPPVPAQPTMPGQPAPASDMAANPPPQAPSDPQAQAYARALLMGNVGVPEEVVKAFLANNAPTEQAKNDTRVGIAPDTRRTLEVAGGLRQAVVPGASSIVNVDANGNPVAQPVAGLRDDLAATEGATTAAKTRNTPIVTPNPFQPGAVSVQFPMPPAMQGGGGGAGAPARGGAPAAAAGGRMPKTAGTAADLEYTQQRGKDAAATMKTYVDAGTKAPANIAKADRIGALLGDFDGGKLSPAGKDIASALNSLGVKIDPKLGNKEAAEALSNQMALELRDPSQGGGMPGAMSDADRNYLKSITPNFAQSAKGRTMIIQTYKAVQQRNAEVADFAQKWEGKYGTIMARNPQGRTFEQELAAWAAQNPMFGAAK